MQTERLDRQHDTDPDVVIGVLPVDVRREARTRIAVGDKGPVHFDNKMVTAFAIVFVLVAIALMMLVTSPLFKGSVSHAKQLGEATSSESSSSSSSAAADPALFIDNLAFLEDRAVITVRVENLHRDNVSIRVSLDDENGDVVHLDGSPSLANGLAYGLVLEDGHVDTVIEVPFDPSALDRVKSVKASVDGGMRGLSRVTRTDLVDDAKKAFDGAVSRGG